MAATRVTIHLPKPVWHTVEALATNEGDTNTVILRALEDYVSATAKRSTRRTGKYRKLVQALRTPVADLHLSAGPASALRINIRYVHELVQNSPVDLVALPNFGKKSLKEIQEKLAALGLTLGMTVGNDANRGAIVATVAAHIEAAKG